MADLKTLKKEAREEYPNLPWVMIDELIERVLNSVEEEFGYMSDGCGCCQTETLKEALANFRK